MDRLSAAGDTLSRPAAKRVSRLLLASVFLWAGSSKLIFPSTGDSLYRSFVGHSPPLHLAFCVGEVLLGGWLLSGWRLTTARSAVAFVLLMFIGTQSYELLRTHPRPCGCGLVEHPRMLSPKSSLMVSLGVNLCLLGMTLALSPIDARPRSGPYPSIRPSP